jgi:hypothetical protein
MSAHADGDYERSRKLSALLREVVARLSQDLATELDQPLFIPRPRAVPRHERTS